MGGLVDSLARRALRKGLRRGLAEGNVTWIALAAAAWLARTLVRPEPAKVTTEDLRVGETIVVRHVPPPPTRRQRRKAARRATRAARRNPDLAGIGPEPRALTAPGA